MVSSVAVLALKAVWARTQQVAATGLVISLPLLAAMTSGCAATTRMAPVERHIVPNAVAQVSLEDFDIVSFIDVDLYTAVQTREAVESEFNSAYGKTGHPRWFFHAFDDANLDFVVARFEPKDVTRPRYVAERRLRVKRTREAERALGVTDVVREYEIGIRGVKAGMSRREVIKVAGRAETEHGVGVSPTGTYDMRYPAFCVRIVDNKVAHVFRRDQCTL